ncbi:MAG: hypothetical protein ACRDZW_09985 [Acidimicrobiales bacterium]
MSAAAAATTADGERAAAFWRRQALLAAVTAAVVLASSLIIMSAVHRAGDPVTLRPGPGGAVTAVAPSSGGSDAAMWLALASVIAVVGLVVVLVFHTVRVARFAAAGAISLRKEP